MLAHSVLSPCSNCYMYNNGERACLLVQVAAHTAAIFAYNHM